MKRFLGAATVVGICVYTAVAFAGNLNTSGKCPATGSDCELGHSGSTSLAVVTDGGTVTFDGSITADSWVDAIERVTTVASGLLSPNRVTVLSAGVDVTIADCETGTVGNWYTAVVRDASETVSISSVDASDIFYVSGLAMDGGDELDSPTAGATTAGASITLVCTQANVYIGIHASGLWVDGGAT
jgi:hypothetical protein